MTQGSRLDVTDLQGSSSNLTHSEGGVLLFFSKTGGAIQPFLRLCYGQRESHYGLLDVIKRVAISVQLFIQ